jgi:excinuclease ABC subunit C
MAIKEKIKQLPLTAGVYLMKSAEGGILYVGKAGSLRRRVSSYFSSSAPLKTRLMAEEITDVDFISCDSPEQALILEAALIKEKKPKYNISLRDGKSYPYIEITKEEFPRIFISRPKKKSKNILFGPYPKAGPLKAALDMIRKIFPYCSCKKGCSPSSSRRGGKSPCLYYHLDLCPAPCAGKVSRLEYKDNISNISKILRGERRKLVRKLKNKMLRLSGSRKFEAAAAIRDKLSAIEALYEGKPKEHAILSLQSVLGLKKVPLVIEAIDISSFGAGDSVGSVVVFRDGLPDKSSYRRFLIKEVSGIDDYAMIAEIVKRRYGRIIRQAKDLPDMVVIDGGRGHVRRAADVLGDLGLELPVIGLAKENEEIWFPDKEKPLKIAKDKPCLHLLQSIRDEAHRFAKAYQLKRRDMRIRQDYRRNR